MQLSPMSWQWYRDFFSLSYLRYMATWFALVPVAAYALSSIPKQISVPLSQPPIILNLTLPFSWQLLWVGSLTFVIAFGIYLLRSPVFVRRYHSLDDYQAMGHSPRWISWEAKNVFRWNSEREKFVKRLVSKGYIVPYSGELTDLEGEVVVNDKTTDFRFSHDKKNYVLSMPIIGENGEEDEILTKIAVREIFWEIFGRYAASRVGERSFIVALLSVSLLSVAIVVGQNILSAAPYVFSRW